jgi:Ser/Thr protein kinase RdoA (MazF antagonist)
MRIVRSTIDAIEILHVIRDNYRDCLHDATCMFEYRGINDIYRYTDGNLSRFFKIYARKDLDRDAIKAEIEIVNHLRQSGLSVAYPIPMMNEHYLFPIKTPEGPRYGVLFSEAEGTPCNDDMLDGRETSEIGRMLSTMHSILDTMSTSPKR